MVFTIALIITTLVILFLIYKLSTRNFDYWKKKNVEYAKPFPIVGNFWEVLTLQTTFFEYLRALYNQFQTRYFGIYIFNRPTLVIRDPELIKHILAKDFSHFCNRSMYTNEKCDPLVSKILFTIKNPEWKQLRLNMNSFFTRKRIKSMMGLMDEVIHDMLPYIEQNLHQDWIETKTISIKYTTDVISSCALGIKANSFQDGQAELSQIGRKLCDLGIINAFRQSCYVVAPIIVKLFRLPFIDPTISNFLRSVFWETIAERMRTKNKRHDVIDIILKLMYSGEDNVKKFDDDTVLAQAVIIFFGGLETSSTTLAFSLYELARNPDVQVKLRKELQATSAQSGLLTSETIDNLQYLDMVVSETLRKYPSLPFLERICTKEYQVPHSDLVIEKGTPIFISNFGINRDPEYFPEPEKYDPERFSDLNKVVSHCFSLPFGFGPRDCIGKLLAGTSVKIALANIILKYQVEVCAKTPSVVRFNVTSFFMNACGDLPLKFNKVLLTSEDL